MELAWFPRWSLSPTRGFWKPSGLALFVARWSQRSNEPDRPRFPLPRALAWDAAVFLAALPSSFAHVPVPSPAAVREPRFLESSVLLSSGERRSAQSERPGTPHARPVPISFARRPHHQNHGR